MAEQLSARKYAEHRKAKGLHGATHTAVRNALNDGRLDGAATRNARGHWLIDPELADRLWEQRTTPTKQRGERGRGGRPPRKAAAPLFEDAEHQPAPTSSGSSPEPDAGAQLTMRKAQEVRAAYQAKLTQLDYLERAGQLVRVAQVRTETFTLARQVREAILQVPDRVAALCAAEDDELRVRNLLNGELTEALRALTRELRGGTS